MHLPYANSILVFCHSFYDPRQPYGPYRMVLPIFPLGISYTATSRLVLTSQVLFVLMSLCHNFDFNYSEHKLNCKPVKHMYCFSHQKVCYIEIYIYRIKTLAVAWNLIASLTLNNLIEPEVNECLFAPGECKTVNQRLSSRMPHLLALFKH